MATPLRDAPRLWPAARPTWEAYCYAASFADGWGGVAPAALDAYFETRRLSPSARRRVRRLLPELLAEDRAISAEKSEGRKRDRPSRAASGRRGRAEPDPEG